MPAWARAAEPIAQAPYADVESSEPPSPAESPPVVEASPVEEAPDQRRWARVEPWQPDADPWGVVVPDEGVADTVAAAPVEAADDETDADVAEAPGTDADLPAGTDVALTAEPEDAPAVQAWPWSRPRDPHELDWLPEPIEDERSAAVDEPVVSDLPVDAPQATTVDDVTPVNAGSHDGGPAPTLDAAGIEIDEPTEVDEPPTVGLPSPAMPDLPTLGATPGPPVVGAEEHGAGHAAAEADAEAAAGSSASDEPAPDEHRAGAAAPDTAEEAADGLDAMDGDDADTGAQAAGAQSAWVARWFARRRSTPPDAEDDELVADEAAAFPDADRPATPDARITPELPLDPAEADEPSFRGPGSDADMVDAPFEPPSPAWVTTPEPLFPPTASGAGAERASTPATLEPDDAMPARTPDRPWSEEEPAPAAAGMDRSLDAPSESTQVLPTSWEPPAPSRTDDRALEPVAGSPRTRLSRPEPDLGEDLEDQPTTAEQAVPWLIGFILLLAGMVIVLLALIFAGDESLAGAGSSPSPTNVAVVTPPSGAPSPSLAATPAPTPTPAPSISVAATPTPLPIPEYGPLEVVYQGRSAALAPIYLLRRDFTVEADPTVMAQDAALDVRRFAWAPDGTRGAGLLSNVLVSIEEGAEKRRLGDDITTITFGAEPSTVYAVRIVQDGGNDVANVLAIDFASGDTTELASIAYPRPSIAEEAALDEAQFADDGGAVRLYWMDSDVLRLWVLGAGSWNITPDGEVSALDRGEVPLLFAPRGGERVSVSDGATSTLVLLDDDGEEVASTTVQGQVSHLRWSPTGERVMFTLGRLAGGGGILQDLFLWDLQDGQAPTQLTNTGANFGAEWLGSAAVWRDE
jgi:hypothetical protein